MPKKILINPRPVFLDERIIRVASAHLIYAKQTRNRSHKSLKKDPITRISVLKKLDEKIRELS